MSKPDNADEVLAQLVAALGELPIADPAPDWTRLPDHQFIRVVARELMTMQRRNFSRARARKGRNELEKIHTEWTKAVARLTALYDDKATEGQLTARELFGQSSKVVREALVVGRALIEHVAVELAEHTPGHRMSRNASVEIVAFLAQQFERLTGAAPHRRVRDGKAEGPFFILVTKVFAALGVTGSAENSVRTFIAKSDSEDAKNSI